MKIKIKKGIQKTEKATEPVTEASNEVTEGSVEIAGNCSKCNGPVIFKWHVGGVRVGEYQECLNCRAKRFPSFGKVISMEPDNIKLTPNKKIKDDFIKDDKDYPTDDSWTRWPYIPPSPTPCPSVPPYPNYPVWPHPIITCGTNTTTTFLSGAMYLH